MGLIAALRHRLKGERLVHLEQQGVGLIPAHTGVGYRNAVLQLGWVLTQILPSSEQVALDHQPYDQVVA